jgi:tetratricopeptide (TPR) repeat protein
MVCKACLTSNALDSAFCKHCGAPLPDDELQVAREKHEELVQHGYALLKDDKVGEAMRVALQATKDNPSSASALSLLGMAHEAKGEIAEALTAFEAVVELKPDSTIDKIKVNHLRHLLVEEAAQARVQPDRRGALAVALSTVLLIGVGAVGLIWATRNSQTTTVAAKDTQAGPNLAQNAPKINRASGFGTQDTGVPANQPPPIIDPNTLLSGGGTQGTNPMQQPQDNERRNNQGREDNGGSKPPSQPGTGLPSGRQGSGNGLPNPEGNGESQVKPFDPGKIKVEPQPGQTPKAPDDGTVVLGNNGGGSGPSGQGNNGKSEPKGSGIIEVKRSDGSGPKGGNTGGGGGGGQESGNSRQALLAAARSSFQAGRYAEAARNYSKAIDMGAGTAGTYQRLGDCYRNLGRRGEAIDAYRQAADLFDSGGNAAGADACRAHIRSLGG